MADHKTPPAKLYDRLLAPNAPLVLDLRTDDDAAADPRRIPTSLSMTLAQIEAGAAPQGPCACSCQKGGKLSQLAAGLLRARGHSASVVVGGHLAWVAAGLPLIDLSPVADRWVMPEDPTWDELSALWLLRRFCDRLAPVLAVERAWAGPACEVWKAAPLPDTPAALARAVGLDLRHMPALGGGPEALLRGRLARVATPDEALDLIDDWLGGCADQKVPA